MWRPSSTRSATSIGTSRSPIEHRLEIKHVFLTHLHADFVAGPSRAPRPFRRDDLPRQGRPRPSTRFVPVGDGDVVQFGKVRMAVLETPGHTVESISLVVYDLGVSESVPQGVLTGDTLFVGRRRPPGPARGARLVGDRAWRDAVRLPSQESPDAAGRRGGLPGSRRRIPVRQGHPPGTDLHHRDGTADELRAAADDEGRVRRSRVVRADGSTRLLHVRRGAEHQRAAHADRDARGRAQAALNRARARAAARGRQRSSTPANQRTSPRPI